MDVFNGNLKAIKKFGLGVLYFGHKVLGQVFAYNAIAGSKKGEYVFNKMAFTVIQVFPVGKSLAQVNFFGCPEAGFGLFIEFPDVVMLDGEEYKTVFVFLQNGFFW